MVHALLSLSCMPTHNAHELTRILGHRHVSNLGAIQDSLKGEPNEAALKAMQGVPNRGTVFEGIDIDGPAIFGSSVLLVVLLLLLFNQVFGLDRLLDRARQKEKKMKQTKRNGQYIMRGSSLRGQCHLLTKMIRVKVSILYRQSLDTVQLYMSALYWKSFRLSSDIFLQRR